MASLIGQRLGDYVLEAELGRGSMGVVYRARHAAQGTEVAVKVLLDVLATDISFITRFIREGRVIAALRHPNIIQVYDTGRQGEHIFFTMEYFRGVTAAQMLRERKRLPVAQVVEIAGQAADALAYAHAQGRLVHRDIKPENLLVDQWNHVKLLDFGLARIEGVRSITQAGTVVGSLYYVSPEQLLGQPLDGRTDVYALGVSMYEMLTGQRPYVGQTLPEMSDLILTATAIPPSQVEPSVPPELERIVAKAMARDLERRYRDAGEMRDDLRVLYLALAQRQSTPSASSAATSSPVVPAPTASAPSAAPAPNGGDPRMTGQRTGYPRRMRVTLRPASLEPVPTQQREAHLTQRPRPHDPRG